MHSTLCFVVFISLFLGIYGDDNLIRGYRRGTSIYHVERPIGLLQCVKLCLSGSNCMSFNYDKNHLMCELRTTTTGSLEQKYNYVHGRRVDFMSIYDVGCLVMQCAKNSRCIFLRNAGYACVKSECAAPVVPIFAQPLTGSYPVAQVVEIKCVTGYLLAGESLLTCKANGLWTSYDAECKAHSPCVFVPSSTGSCFSGKIYTDIRFTSGCDFPPSNINNIGGGSGSLKIGGTYTYSCRAGYAQLGNPTITCQSDATWSTVEFTCVFSEKK